MHTFRSSEECAINKWQMQYKTFLFNCWIFWLKYNFYQALHKKIIWKSWMSRKKLKSDLIICIPNLNARRNLEMQISRWFKDSSWRTPHVNGNAWLLSWTIWHSRRTEYHFESEWPPAPTGLPSGGQRINDKQSPRPSDLVEALTSKVTWFRARRLSKGLHCLFPT